MVKTLLTTKDILNKTFKHAFRGFDIGEVDEFLDAVIRDYDAYQKEIAFLQNENERLIAKVDELSRQANVSQATRQTTPSGGVTNFDILKRLSNLEKHVFDAKLSENTSEADHAPQTDRVNDEDLYKTRVISPIND